MNKILFTTSRILVGILFIFSGFVKAIDPSGSAIKFSDYLSAFGMESLLFATMPLAFIVAALEFLTGIHLLLSFRIKTSAWLALLFMAFFTPLTLGIAIFEPVTDCGCFGDALKLSNWNTFFKNLVFSVPTLYLFHQRKNYFSPLNTIRQLILTVGFSLGILGVAQYGVKHLPLIDFRPYNIGANIYEGMTFPEGAEQPEYETTFIMEKNGQRKEFGTTDYPYSDSTWVFIESKTKVLKKGYEPPIHDFVLLNDDGNDMVPELLDNKNPTLLVVSYQIAEGNWGENLDKIKALNKQLINKGYSSYTLTSSSNDDITQFEFGTEAGFNYLIADETMLKTVVRSNPGLVLIQDGNIIGKWHYNDIPETEEFNNPTSFAISQTHNKRTNLAILVLMLISALFSIVFMRTKK